MHKNPLDMYLEKVASGETAYMDKLCRRLAQRLVYVPVRSKAGVKLPDTDLSSHEFITISTVEGEFVAIFTTEARMKAWSAVRGAEYAYLTILAYELCAVLRSDLGLIVNSVSENKVTLEPQWVKKILNFSQTGEAIEPLRNMIIKNIREEAAAAEAAPQSANTETAAAAETEAVSADAVKPAEEDVFAKIEKSFEASVALMDEEAITQSAIASAWNPARLRAPPQPGSQESRSDGKPQDLTAVKTEVAAEILHDAPPGQEPAAESGEKTASGVSQDGRRVITLYHVVTDEELEKYRVAVMDDVAKSNAEVRKAGIDLTSAPHHDDAELPAQDEQGAGGAGEEPETDSPEEEHESSSSAFLRFWK